MKSNCQIPSLLGAIWLIAQILVSSTPVRAEDAGDFDLYVLSLSWSPAYCATHQSDTNQCVGKHFGMVVHGLWPQYAQSHQVSGKTVDWPANCRTGTTGSTPADAAAVWPTAALYRHEWQAHGSCSGLTQDGFVALTSKLRQRVQLPAALMPSHEDQRIEVSTLQQSILDANPAMLASDFRLFCRKDQLAEIRFCMNRNGDYGYRTCPDSMSKEGPCPSTVTLHGLSDGE